ncbi:MAG: hypothetical protein II724_02915 [Clostridia bacterium]|nr:hypothetical protein [Clostridia bacterium]
MNGNEFMEALTELDSDVIDTELPKKSRKSKSVLRWIAAAACLLIVLGSVTAYAESKKMETKKIKTVTESGFTIRVDLDKIRQKELSGLTDIPEKIAEQINNHVPQPVHSSVFIDPRTVTEIYPGIAEAIRRIGYDKICAPQLPPCGGHPSDLGFSDIHGITHYDGSEVLLTVRGSDAGRILSVTISYDDISAETDHINMQPNIIVITDNYNGKELELSSFWPNERGWETDIEHRTTKNGLDFELLTIDGVDNGRRGGLDGYVSNDSVLYTLHLSYELENSERAMEIMLAWADSIR